MKFTHKTVLVSFFSAMLVCGRQPHMIRPKVSKTSLVRAFSGGSAVFTEAPRSYELPVAHQHAPPPPVPTPPRFAHRMAVVLRLANLAFLLTICLGMSPVQLRLMCNVTRVPLHAVAFVVLIAALVDDEYARLAPSLRHVAAVIAACVAAQFADVATIALACAAVLSWPVHTYDLASACAWTVAWAFPIGMLSRVSSVEFICVIATAVVLAVEAVAEQKLPTPPSRLAKEVVAELCTVALLALPRVARDPATLCVK